MTNGTKGIRQGGNRSAMQKIAMESSGFTVAELTSVATSLGVVAVADQIAPNLLKTASKAVAKTCILPFLNPIEKGMDKFCQLEECKADPSQSREERAERIAHTVILFSASWVAAMAVKLATRRGMNRMMGLPEDGPWWKIWHLSGKEKIIFGMDEGVHYGSLILLNTGLAQYTDEMIRTTSGILEKAGMSKKKAKEISSMAMIWELPNLLGLFSGLGGIIGVHKYGWGKKAAASHVEKLAESTALNSHTITPGTL